MRARPNRSPESNLSVEDGASLRLERIAGPPLAAIEIAAEESRLLGRGAECDIRLEHDCVSRRHCSLRRVGGQWLVVDEGSRHGTHVNGTRLNALEPAPLRDGDVVRIEPWHLIVRQGIPDGSTLTTFEDEIDAAGQVEVIPATAQAPIAQQRLEVLIECAAAVAQQDHERSLAQCIVQAAVRGTPFQRAAVLRPLGAGGSRISAQGPVDSAESRAPGTDQSTPGEGLLTSQPLASPSAGGDMEIVADIGMTRAGVPIRAPLSRSLLRAASGGEVAMLNQAEQQTVSLHSLQRFGVQAALCAPIEVGSAGPGASRGGVYGYLYLDASDSMIRSDQDLATFCKALARLYGLALASIRARELESHRRLLEADLLAAREAQRLIMPSLHGRHDRLAYALRSRPGRYVAGDLFDVVPVPGNKVAFFLGDVTGKGVGAGILMTATQSYLHAVLGQCDDPAVALRMVTRHIMPRKPANTFVSLWLGVFDPARGRLLYVDAGHGFWLLRRAGGRPAQVPCSGGVFVGADPDADYQHESLDLHPGDRLILFSDGVVEQKGRDGQRFGLPRAISALADADSSAADVERLFRAVQHFAGVDALDDDTTVAAVEFLTAP